VKAHGLSGIYFMSYIGQFFEHIPFNCTSCLCEWLQFPIVQAMGLLAGGLILLIAGLVLRRVLRMDSSARGELELLTPGHVAIYTPISQEVETQVAIINISLNDAFEERDSGNHEIAWRLVTLAASEWDRVAKIITALLDALQKNLPEARALVPYRGIVSRRFKSHSMIENLRLYELLNKLVYRSRMRFQLQVHMLRRAAANLTMEFNRTYQYGERTDDRPPELWQRLDIYSHDFDLVSKEALMAFHAFLICLPPSALHALASDLEPVLRRGVRMPAIPAQL
jgi:hypothetical protein